MDNTVSTDNIKQKLVKKLIFDKSIDRFGTIGQIFEVIGVKSYG